MRKARLEDLYITSIRQTLRDQIGLKGIMQVPKINKIVLNVGVKDAVTNSKVLQEVIEKIGKIAGQRPVRRLARKSIAGFKLREGMPIGVMVTLRRKNMYEFLDRLISLALPKVRDFRGLSPKFDRRGNYNLGIKDWTIFPEIEFDIGKKVYGMNITIETTTKNDEQALALLLEFGMPFMKTL